ncbi:MAG: hypothetical protein QGG73_06415 [Candidatus Hydrogenedentes bacterium]|jgi:hypothetical protein|nr:hypothetical protein [Candidatus Hydrogenedentota bacterium]
MQPKVSGKIERHLDEKLGPWTRLLPWRREVVLHLEEAYETSRATRKRPDLTVDEDVWRQVLDNF